MNRLSQKPWRRRHRVLLWAPGLLCILLLAACPEVRPPSNWPAAWALDPALPAQCFRQPAEANESGWRGGLGLSGSLAALVAGLLWKGHSCLRLRLSEGEDGAAARCELLPSDGLTRWSGVW